MVLHAHCAFSEEGLDAGRPRSPLHDALCAAAGGRSVEWLRQPRRCASRSAVAGPAGILITAVRTHVSTSTNTSLHHKRSTMSVRDTS